LAILTFGEKTIAAKAVIFDKDGTLTLFEPMWLEIAKIRSREIVRALQVDEERADSIYRRLLQTMGINPDTLQINPRGPLAIAPRFEDMIAVTTGLFLQGYNWDEAREIVKNAFDCADEMVDRSALLQPVEGMIEVLGALKEAGVKIAIATTDTREGINMLLNKLDLATHIDYIVTGDSATLHKPDPEMIILACKALGVEPAEAVMVGDASVDMIMGLKAGVGARVAVLTGLTSRERLEPLSDAVLDSVADIRVQAPHKDHEEAGTNFLTQNIPVELTIYSDGGSRGNPGPAGIGVAIYKQDSLICEIGEYIGEATNNIAEYKALIRGLEKCKQLGAVRVQAYADSELLVKQINGQYKVKNEGLLPLFQQVCFLSKNFEHFTIAHVRREKNKVADALANKGMDERIVSNE